MATATSPPVTGLIPKLTLGWRLKMALEACDVSAQRMARELGVNRATISRWMHDRGAPPRRAFVLQWATLTGVDPFWLLTGDASRDRDTPPYAYLVHARRGMRIVAASKVGCLVAGRE